MDLLKLNASTYLPEELIEAYDSLIWTERYNVPGDFELKTTQIDVIKELIPVGTLLTIRESNTIMLAESHLIQTNSEGFKELTITGRTLDSFLEHRPIMSSIYNENWVVYRTYTPSNMASLLIWAFMVSTSGEDPTEPAKSSDALYAVPNLVVTNSVSLTEPVMSWTLSTGLVSEHVASILNLSGLGLRTIKRNSDPGDVMTFDTTRTINRGLPTKTPTADLSSKIRFDVYNGIDRSKDQSTNSKVIFYHQAGHIDNPSYLTSVKDVKQVAKVSSELGQFNIWPDTTPAPDTSVSGLNRKGLLISADSQGSLSNSDYTLAYTQQARTDLQKHRQKFLFDGNISINSPFVYDQDYFLGDIITLMGEYNYVANMRVNEYVRTKSIEGVSGYPGLIMFGEEG